MSWLNFDTSVSIHAPLPHMKALVRLTTLIEDLHRQNVKSVVEKVEKEVKVEPHQVKVVVRNVVVVTMVEEEVMEERNHHFEVCIGK